MKNFNENKSLSELEIENTALRAELSRYVNMHIIKVSAVYFPKTGEVEATWSNSEGKDAYVTFPVSKDVGERIAEIVTPCVYVDAIIESSDEDVCADYPVDFSKGITKDTK